MHLSSRFWSARMTAVSFALAVAGMSASVAMAQTKTLYIGMNGGVMEKTWTEHVFPAFEKANNAKVVVVPGTSSDILAKAQANKDKPQMHVMFLDDGIMVRAIGMGLCEKMKPSAALNEVFPAARFKGDMATGVTMGMTGLVYNKKMFAEKGWAAPTSWMDLADPKFKGKVVFQSLSSSTFGLHGFLMFNRIKGGTDKNVEPGFNAWKTSIGSNVLEYIPSSAKLSEMMQTGEAAIAPLTPTAVAGLQEKGIAVEYAQPKEGSVVLMSAECVLANNSEPVLAQKLAEYLLTAEAQAAGLQHGNQIPSNPKSQAVGDDAKLKLKQFGDYMKTAVTVDWDVINENRPAWNARWNKTIER
ncbi:putative spermidine/putrescine transport system substrate-binding protein [Polaromonas sp. OV174]|uniref:ABC transporter substrate-binding protein n=1 Tax=Polaromonas sp. OV174 TaxID=1855300 RepID=UPI0008E7F6B3|nr:putative spermidine/putrescine transport system substrate-binding protein [Polaromonas sp. OV174]